MTTENTIDLPVFPSFTKKWHNKPYDLINPSRPELSASGKNVVVTGGGTGIGKAVATAFAQAGAKSVSILGRRLDRLETASRDINAAGAKTTVIKQQTDLTKLDQIQRALQAIFDQVGPIDVMVSNAGMLPKLDTIVGYDGIEFNRGLELNLFTAFNCVQAFVPLAAPGAKLFAISSGIAHFSPMPGMVNYAVGKAAMTKMMDYVQAENPDLHVVNIQPGVVDTEINHTGTPIGQDDPGLPGGFLVWLASPEAQFLKGKYVWVNWDVEELMSRAEEIENSLILRVLLNGVPF